MSDFTEKFFLGKLQIFILVFLLLCSSRASATHISGADITYRWISGNSFEITLTLYRDCTGIAAPTNVAISYSSAACGYSLSATLNPIPGTGQELTRPCSTATTTCTGGTNPGIQEYRYRGIITLPARCTDWHFGYTICCRNCAITTLSFGNNCNNVPGMYVEATLNNVVAPTNSSPTFTNVPVTFVCIGQQFNYNQGTIDANGDSVVYSFITPRDQFGTNVSFKNPFTASNPLSSSPAVALNGSTGNLTMTPTATEVAVMAILVREYRNGVLIGTVIRDMQIWTQPCSNALPTATGINGTTNFILNSCPGQPIRFTVNSADANAGQTVTMTWNSGIFGATFTSSGGARPVGTFNWTPTAANASNQPYTFVVTVTDNNCPMLGYQTYTYSILVRPIAAIAFPTASWCAIPGNGTASVNPTGTAPFTYSWSPGGMNTANISGLTPGNYTVTVTDPYGCTTTSSALVTGPTPVTASVTGIANINCFGDNNGTASVNAAGGVPGYTYNWSPLGGTAASASNLTAGNYTVTVYDSRNCTKTSSVTITQPTALNVVTTRTNILCNGNTNGTASVVASGGVGPYTYDWSPSGYSTASITALTAGAYTTTITDARGCTSTSTATILQPAAISLSANVVSATCNSANGSATIIANGGVGPYTYAWTPGGNTSATLSGISGGSYNVTVTDANGCTETIAVGISNAGGPVVNIQSTTPVSCNNGTNGAASVTANGIGPLTYQWTPSGGNGTTAGNLPAGSYTVTVRDANNCISAVPVTINEPTPISVATNNTDVNCFNQNDGTATVNVSGGSSPYTYQWSNSATSSSLTGLAAGNYTVTVTDAHSCTSSRSVSVTQPTLLSNTVTSTPVSCSGGSNGIATVNANGGVVPYSYSWTPSVSSGSVATGLAAGAYSVVITDGNNCTLTVPISISQPNPLTTAINAITNVACSGNATATASASANGGVTPYSYLWSNSAPGASLSSITAGTYTVTVSDANGCTSTAATTITEPSPLLSMVVGPNNVSCFGGNDGQAALNVNGGVGPYSYVWRPNVSSTSSATNLSAGTYNVLITDANGCTQASLVSINQPSSMTSTILTTTPVSCTSGSNGAGEITVTGGIGPYTYAWSPTGGTNTAANSLAAGSYTVLATDANGCTNTISVTITEPNPVSTTFSSTPSTCGNANGTASVSALGGTPGYSYFWSNSISNDTIGNVLAGTYSVVITDANGCTTSASTTISNIPGPSAVNLTSTDVACYNGLTGSSSATVVGGTSPFQFSWSPSGGTLSNEGGLASGTYTVTVTDANSCANTASITITQPPLLNVSIAASANASCSGGNNGSVSLAVSGGTSPYGFTWTPNVSSTITAAGLTAGTYSSIVTDANGCTQSIPVTITQPTPVTAALLSTTPVSCASSSNGTASVLANGGTAPYAYSWSPSGGSASLASGLSSGNYTVTSTDANGCSTITALSITQPTPITSSFATLVTHCGRANGAASVNASGGVPGYTYSWSNSSSNDTISTILAGTYSVTITDANGCTSSSSVLVTDIPGPSVVNTNNTDVSCFNTATGSATATPIGGTTPYQYSWSPSGGATSTAGNLISGTYTVTVTDANTCIQTATVTISQPAILSASVATSTNISCNGGNNGSASAAVAGGTGPFTYSWSPLGGSSAIAIGLTANTYTISIRDALGCTATTSVTLSQPTALALITAATAGTCNLPNGSASVNTSGGVAPYTFAWTNGQTSASANGMATGNYSVTITDAQGCSASSSINVTNLGLFTANVSSTNNVSCFGRNDGAGSVNTSGGQTPYTYSWTPSGGNAATASNLISGNYTVTITDANHCTQIVPVAITQPQLLTSVTSGITPVKCFSGSDGSATILPAGGTTGYTYLWTPGNYTSAIVNTLSSGNYSVLVTDTHGCTTSTSVTIVQPTPIASSYTFTPAGCNLSNGTATISPSGGTAPYTYLWSTGAITATTNNIPAGSYSVTITDAHTCTLPTSASVSNIGGPTLAVSTLNAVSCNGGNNGSASVVATGNAPFTYQWSPSGGSNAGASNLSSGLYIASVRDVNNCITSIPVTVAQPTALNGIIQNSSVSCNGGTNGNATCIPSGGTAPYTYLWSNGSITITATLLTAGNYSVIITDSHSCTVNEQTLITQPSGMTISSTTSPVSCTGGSNGSLLASAIGGAGGFSYHWSSGSNNAVANNLSAGTYIVTVTDANNCTATSSASVNEPLALALQTTSSTTLCHGSSDGSASVTPTGGTQPYRYRWTPGGSTSSMQSNIASGTYQVTVTDNNGCTSNASATVSNAPILLTTTSSSNVSCNGGIDGSATVTPTGGTPPYDCNWNTSVSGVTATGLFAGNYSVIVNDDHGCTTTAFVTITEPTPVVATATSVGLVCIGQQATLAAQATGGYPPYSYQWNNGAITQQQNITIYSAISFSVAATDANGCPSSPASVAINVQPSLAVITSIGDTICQGEYAHLNANASGGNGGPYTYVWDNGSSGSNLTIQPQTTSTYTVTVNDGCGTPPASAVAGVLVYPVPLLNISNSDMSGCVPLTVHFQPNGASPGTLYNWTFGDGGTSTDPNPTHVFSHAGNYSVTLFVQTPEGCIATSTVPSGVKVYPLSEADFTLDPTETSIYTATITFRDLSRNANQWYWNFGDSIGLSSLRNPNYTYTDTGTYEIQLITKSSQGCPDTAYSKVRINGEFAIFIPNAFTPNDDHVNDFFKPLGIGIKETEMWIYDRWGLMIFHSSDPDKGWDGRIAADGEPCQSDVYVYVVQALDLTDKKHRYIGHVSLVR